MSELLKIADKNKNLGINVLSLFEPVLNFDSLNISEFQDDEWSLVKR